MSKKNEITVKQMMKLMTKDVINFASAERGRVLITDNEIRLQFDSKEQAIRFIEAISDRHPNIRLKTCSFFRSVDVLGPELFAVA